MKKLMIAAAIVCAAAISQGASVVWSTGTQVKGVTSATDGTFSGTNAGDGSLMTYVWLVDADTYGKTDIGSIWDSKGSSLGTATAKSAAAFGGKKGGSATTADIPWTADQNTPVYALILTTYDTNGDGTADWYIANKAESNINGAGMGADVTNLAKNIGGTGGTAITGWTAAGNVPEPTSAMLILLGMAGLALRRRRA